MSLAIETTAAPTAGELRHVNPSTLVLCPQRRELDVTEIGDLKTAEYSCQRPTIVQSTAGGQYEVLDGWRTVLMAIEKGIDQVPVWDVGQVSEEEGLVRILREELPRRSANPIFLMFAIRRLREFRPDLGTDRKLAQFFGCSRGHIQRVLKLADLAPPLLAKLRSGELKKSTAYQLSRLDDHAVQQQVAEEAAANHWQHARLGEAVEARLPKRPGRPFVETTSEVADAATLTQALEQTRPSYQAWPPIRRFLTGLIQSLNAAEKSMVVRELRALTSESPNNPFAEMAVPRG